MQELLAGDREFLQIPVSHLEDEGWKAVVGKWDNLAIREAAFLLIYRDLSGYDAWQNPRLWLQVFLLVDLFGKVKGSVRSAMKNSSEVVI